MTRIGPWSYPADRRLWVADENRIDLKSRHFGPFFCVECTAPGYRSPDGTNEVSLCVLDPLIADERLASGTCVPDALGVTAYVEARVALCLFAEGSPKDARKHRFNLGASKPVWSTKPGAMWSKLTEIIARTSPENFREQFRNHSKVDDPFAALIRKWCGQSAAPSKQTSRQLPTVTADVLADLVGAVCKEHYYAVMNPRKPTSHIQSKFAQNKPSTIKDKKRTYVYDVIHFIAEFVKFYANPVWKLDVKKAAQDVAEAAAVMSPSMSLVAGKTQRVEKYLDSFMKSYQGAAFTRLDTALRSVADTALTPVYNTIHVRFDEIDATDPGPVQEKDLKKISAEQLRELELVHEDAKRRYFWQWLYEFDRVRVEQSGLAAEQGGVVAPDERKRISETLAQTLAEKGENYFAKLRDMLLIKSAGRRRVNRTSNSIRVPDSLVDFDTGVDEINKRLDYLLEKIEDIVKRTVEAVDRKPIMVLTSSAAETAYLTASEYEEQVDKTLATSASNAAEGAPSQSSSSGALEFGDAVSPQDIAGEAGDMREVDAGLRGHSLSSSNRLGPFVRAKAPVRVEQNDEYRSLRIALVVPGPGGALAPMAPSVSKPDKTASDIVLENSDPMFFNDEETDVVAKRYAIAAIMGELKSSSSLGSTHAAITGSGMSVDVGSDGVKRDSLARFVQQMFLDPEQTYGPLLDGDKESDGDGGEDDNDDDDRAIEEWPTETRTATDQCVAMMFAGALTHLENLAKSSEAGSREQLDIWMQCLRLMSLLGVFYALPFWCVNQDEVNVWTTLLGRASAVMQVDNDFLLDAQKSTWDAAMASFQRGPGAMIMQLHGARVAVPARVPDPQENVRENVQENIQATAEAHAEADAEANAHGDALEDASGDDLEDASEDVSEESSEEEVSEEESEDEPEDIQTAAVEYEPEPGDLIDMRSIEPGPDLAVPESESELKSEFELNAEPDEDPLIDFSDNVSEDVPEGDSAASLSSEEEFDHTYGLMGGTRLGGIRGGLPQPALTTVEWTNVFAMSALTAVLAVVGSMA